MCVVAPGSSLAADAADDAPSAYGQTVVGLPDWEDADAATRGVVVALREAGAACAPLGFSRDETDVEADVLDLRGKKAVVFLGVGGRRERGAVPRDSIDFDGDGCALVGASAARVDALRAFVESGGVFVVNGSGEHAERAFAWFGLPWRFAKERARGEYEPNVEACDVRRLVSESRGSATLRAWARGERGFYAVAGFDGVVHVTPAQRVFHARGRLGAQSGKKNRRVSRERSRPVPAGGGAVRARAGGVRGRQRRGDATCELIASLACSPPGETREYPGR